MHAREGDFIESVEGLIFDVKGLVHPVDKVIAFVRYFPDERGVRRRGSITYSKVYSLSERLCFLAKNFPEYVVYDPVFSEKLSEVPIKKVKLHHKPAERLEQLRKHKENLDELESRTVGFSDILTESANVSSRSIGVSGSILVSLHDKKSDIDLIIYGIENCRKVHNTLKSLTSRNGQNAHVDLYSLGDLKALFKFRSKDTMIDFKDFIQTESRKVLQGKFAGTDYFIRFVKNWDEVDEKYGDVSYVNIGYTRVKATVIDDANSIFTPCSYKIGDVQVLEGPQVGPIREIASFRGRFCEQARNGEVVVAQGKIEHVIDTKQDRQHFRILLGNSPSDYMIQV